MAKIPLKPPTLFIPFLFLLFLPLTLTQQLKIIPTSPNSPTTLSPPRNFRPYYDRHQSKFRDLTSCNTYSNCTSCNAVDGCLWSGGVCTTTTNNKTLSDYKTCEDPTLSAKYCVNYGSFPADLPAKITTLKHQPDGGVIEPGVYCEWEYSVNPKYVHKMTIERPNENGQFFQIYLEGKRGENITITNDGITRATSDFNIYNAAKIMVSSVQKIQANASTYEVVIQEFSTSTGEALIGLLTIIMTVCIFMVLCTCLFAMMRACCKVREHNLRIRHLEQANQARRRDHQSKVSKILQENPSIQFKNITVKFEQTNCVICLEEFSPRSTDKVRIMPECQHIFHSSCLEKWFDTKDNNEINCPHCNVPILTKEELKKKRKEEDATRRRAHRKKSRGSILEMKESPKQEMDSFMSHSAMNRLNEVEENLRNFQEQDAYFDRPVIQNILPRIDAPYAPTIQEEVKVNEDNKGNDNKITSINQPQQPNNSNSSNGRGLLPMI